MDYRRSLPTLWAISGPDGQALVVWIFPRLEVLGLERLEYELTPDSIDLGLDAELPAIMELGRQIPEFGRDARGPATNDLPITMRLAEPPIPLDLVRSA